MKKYTAKTLQEACDAYFRSISYEVQATRQEYIGLDDKRRPMYEPKPAYTDDGAPIMVREYAVKPSLQGLLIRLGISKVTWEKYAKDAKLGAVCARVKAQFEEWLVQELLSRDGKNTRGIEFNLARNYGWREQSKTELELGERATAAAAGAGLTMEERFRLLDSIKDAIPDGEETETG